MKPRLVILDRDDTLIQVPPGRRYLFGDDPIRFVPEAPAFVAALNHANISVVVVTNQQGVALAEYPEMTLEAVLRFHERLQETLLSHAAHIDRFYVCPHAANAGCNCRKPRPGMYLQAMSDFDVKPQEAAVVGDQIRDIKAAVAAGIRSVWWLRSGSSAVAPVSFPADVRTIRSLSECSPYLSG